jgi:hypothetical protein
VAERPELLRGALGVTASSLAFHVGALVYPKDMLREYGLETEILPAQFFKGASPRDGMGAKATRVIEIYQFLYRFSVERLHTFIQDPNL